MCVNNDNIVATESWDILFDSRIMKKYTKGSNKGDFFTNAGVNIPNGQGKPSQSDIKQLDVYTRRTTQFENWSDMFNRASEKMRDTRPSSLLKIL